MTQTKSTARRYEIMVFDWPHGPTGTQTLAGLFANSRPISGARVATAEGLAGLVAAVRDRMRDEPNSTAILTFNHQIVGNVTL